MFTYQLTFFATEQWFFEQKTCLKHSYFLFRKRHLHTKELICKEEIPQIFPKTIELSSDPGKMDGI